MDVVTGATGVLEVLELVETVDVDVVVGALVLLVPSELVEDAVAELLVDGQKLSYHVQYASSSAALQESWIHASTAVLPQRLASLVMLFSVKQVVQQAG